MQSYFLSTPVGFSSTSSWCDRLASNATISRVVANDFDLLKKIIAPRLASLNSPVMIERNYCFSFRGDRTSLACIFLLISVVGTTIYINRKGVAGTSKKVDIPKEENDDDLKVQNHSIPQLDPHQSLKHDWNIQDVIRLVYYPLEREYKDYRSGVNLKFTLNPENGDISIQIPQSKELFCLQIAHLDELAYSKQDDVVECKFNSVGLKSTVYIFKFDCVDKKWKPSIYLSVLIEKYDIPLIISAENRKKEINDLAVKKNNVPCSFFRTELWIGKGKYIIESGGILAAGDVFSSGKYIQDLKIIAYCALENPDPSVLLKKNESEARILQKKANMNCWQFCLLAYMEEGLISLKTIGLLYKLLETLEKKRVPDAFKFGRNKRINYITSLEDKDAIMKSTHTGDIICFGHEFNKDWHCAIFKEYHPEDRSFSVIEISNKHVDVEERIIMKTEGITIVKSCDVEENILNFLNFYS
jgi:hypothetical protein